MSTPVANNLNRVKIEQLLAAIGSQPAADTTQLQLTKHNWHQPNYFNTEQIGKLNDFTNRLAAALAEKLARFYSSDSSVTISSTTIHFAGQLADQIRAGTDYYLAFGPDPQHLFGLLGIPAKTAGTWVTLLLGDTECEKDPDKNLSQLEESLLLDIARAIVEALSACVKDYYKLQPADAVTRQLPIQLTDIEELCKISFEVKKNNPPASSQAYFITPCSSLAPVVGKTTQAQDASPHQDISNIVLDLLQQMPVCVTARLSCTALTFEEIVNLSPNDIILLNKPLDEPIELLVQGRTAFYGRLAKSGNRQAVIITEPPSVQANSTTNTLKAA